MLYYTPPKDEQFDELKEKAIEIWQTYDNKHGYVDEKVGAIQDIKNVSDNFMYMVAMFDTTNQAKLAKALTDETRKAVANRIKDGGAPDNSNVFLDDEFCLCGGVKMDESDFCKDCV